MKLVLHESAQNDDDSLRALSIAWKSLREIERAAIFLAIDDTLVKDAIAQLMRLVTSSRKKLGEDIMCVSDEQRTYASRMMRFAAS